MEQIHFYMSSFDIVGLHDYWTFLDQHLFSHLELMYASCVRKLTTGILRLYIIGAIQAGRNDKVVEFFEKMTPQLHGQVEWKDWFSEYLLTYLLYIFYQFNIFIRILELQICLSMLGITAVFRA